MTLVVGASGQLGSRIVRRLLDRGERVRAISRDPARLRDSLAAGAEAVRGDLRDPSWMDEALRGARTLILAAHGLVPPSRSNDVVRVDGEGNRRIIDVAVRAGVVRVAFVSTDFAAPGSPLAFGRIKHGIEEHLKGSGLEYFIVRPTAFTETHALLLLGEPLRAGRKVVLLGRARTRINWISAEDVAGYLVDRLETPGARNATVTIGGPDVLSRLEVLEILEGALGKKAKRRHVPPWALRAARVVAKPFNPGVSYLMEMVLAEEDAGPAGAAPSRLDWCGPTSVAEVVRRWAPDG